MNDNIIPEYKCNSFLAVYDGAELYQIDNNGIHTLIAVFNEIDGMLLMCTMAGNYQVWLQLGMVNVDKGVYQKWVEKNI